MLKLATSIQSVLDFEGWNSVQFVSATGLGRVGLAAFLLGTLFGLHVAIVIGFLYSLLISGAFSVAAVCVSVST
jgi:hypothetical protein